MGGRKLTTKESKELQQKIVGIPDGLLVFMKTYPVVDATFRLPEKSDLSGVGVRMKWLSPEGMVDEALEFYPGIAAIPAGCFPIGECVVGSGNPYFYRTSDGAVVRILHASGGDPDTLSESQVEVVAANPTSFIEMAQDRVAPTPAKKSK
jgi:hypothetical protein